MVGNGCGREVRAQACRTQEGLAAAGCQSDGACDWCGVGRAQSALLNALLCLLLGEVWMVNREKLGCSPTFFPCLSSSMLYSHLPKEDATVA